MKNDKKIKILFVIASSTIGGVERNLLDYFDAGDRDSFEFYVGSLKSGGILEKEIKERKIPFYNVRKISSLYQLVKKKQINIIQLYGLRANVKFRFLAKLAGCKVVSTIMSIDLNRKWYHVFLDRMTSFWVDVWISNSYAGKEIAIKREKFPGDKIKVIHNGIDLSSYVKSSPEEIIRLKQYYGIQEDDFVVGEVANLREMKGHVDIINAIPMIIDKYKNVKFFFAGEDTSNGEIEKYAKIKGADKYIIFAGFCSEIPKILSLFDVFILPSLWEGLPTAIIEAMAIGLPVIATKIGGIPELISDGENGILIEPRSHRQIASAILYLLENKDVSQKMREKNIIKAWKNYDIKQRAMDYEKIYIELTKT